MSVDPIRLEVFKHLFSAIAEEMGVVLRKASFSPNIKERRDFSCALFDSKGLLIAQATHIPVHLGAMPLSVEAAIKKYEGDDLQPGDIIILNDPFMGGTHLPDITMVSPVFVILESGVKQALVGFMASRAHHADVGGITPGSMPVATEIYQEGLIIPPIKLIEAGTLNHAVLGLIMANIRTPQERTGDLSAQIAANQRGAQRLIELIERYGVDTVCHFMDELLFYTESMTRRLLTSLPNGEYSFSDQLDDDGITDEPIPIVVKISIKNDQAVVDFSGSAPQQLGCVNAVWAITLSAVYYVFRCLIGLDVPNNSGCLAPIQVIAPRGTVVNALRPAAVAGGNVETSQRIVDVLLGALAQACPGKIPAASQGTMNNISIGGNYLRDEDISEIPFTYYETVGGGMGARAGSDGCSAIHSHMTNTLNTPIEALEYAYPLRVLRYEIRRGTGGIGKFRGDDGIRRDIQLLTDAHATLLCERRRYAPYGLEGGGSGQCGENILIRDNREIVLPGKGSFELHKGDVLSIRTPGGGGYYPKEDKR